MDTRDERRRCCLMTECWRGIIGVGTFSLLEFTTVFETYKIQMNHLKRADYVCVDIKRKLQPQCT